MDSKIVSFQIVQPNVSSHGSVVAMCEDGSLWKIDLGRFNYSGMHNWERMTPTIRDKNPSPTSECGSVLK